MYHKIFNFGLPKTGTTSLNLALNALGLKALHNPKAFRKQAMEGQYRFENDDWRAITNFGEHFYPQLDQAYPNSKFILTVRSEMEWLNSWKKQVGNTTGDEMMTRYAFYRPLKVWLREVKRAFGYDTWITHKFSRLDIFGAYKFNAERCLYVYRLHKKNAIEYFQDRPQDFIIMDVCAGDGWEKLCPFLDIADIPTMPFPWKRPESAPFASK